MEKGRAARKARNGCRAPQPLQRTGNRWRCVLHLLLIVAARAQPQGLFGDPPMAPLARLKLARDILDAAFAAPSPGDEVGGVMRDSALVMQGFQHLQEFGSFLQRVSGSGWQDGIIDETGNVQYKLSDDDQLAINAYADQSVFIFGDLLPLLLLPEDAFLDAIRNEERHPALKWKRIVNALRVSFDLLLVSDRGVWPVPFFGSLAGLVERLRGAMAKDATSDPYRELLVANGSYLQPSSRDKMPLHVNVVAAPVLPATFSRDESYRRASAWLSIALASSDDPVARSGAVGAAERDFKAFDMASLRITLEHAAQWPVFHLLHALAREKPTMAPLPPPPEPSRLDGAPEGVRAEPARAGEQRLPAAQALELYRLLHVVGQLCDALGITWWVSHGTLVGALRDGGLSRHADDCELDIFEADAEAFQSTRMRAALARNGYELGYDPRGRCFKVFPAGSQQANAVAVGEGESENEQDVQLSDQSWWLPQQRVGTPSLDIYIVQTPAGPESTADVHYVSNERFHCSERRCDAIWRPGELDAFAEVPFGHGRARVPIGAEPHLTRVYGDDWRDTIRPHRDDVASGRGFEPIPASTLPAGSRAAEPSAPLPTVVVPAYLLSVDS
eukprot:TRINITY_DN32147_c0_g1_i1.p1 TRINITY_DN32147_c0_g1~~TRINITY_DN32147_c0_g1_i1.p1  ORF type:complete len:616 (+),score=125.20 TRINITY_DN32147_c0_g1_i1:48-1895(+)